MKSKYKNIIIIVIIILIGILIYSLTRPDPDIETGLRSTTPNQSREEILGQVIIRALGQVSALNLNRDILNDNVLQSLRDKSSVITPVSNPGRQNPFAPFGQTGLIAPATPETQTAEQGSAEEVNNN
jgi:hypothetical protein